MKVIILAGGRGKRFDPLTRNIPKPLIPVLNKPILEHILSVLPEAITEILMVVGYLGEKIEKRFGSSFGQRPIYYIRQGQAKGTAAALWSSRDFLTEERFLVLNGDDLYQKEELEECLKYPLAFGVYKYGGRYRQNSPRTNFFNIELDELGNIKSFCPVQNRAADRLVATGVYVLDHRIFDYEPVLWSNGEYVLPQTIFKMARTHQIRAVLMRHWLPINYPEDLEQAAKILSRGF